LLSQIFYLTTKKNHISNIFFILGIIIVVIFTLGILQGSDLKIFSEGIETIENRNDLSATVSIIIPLIFILLFKTKLNMEKTTSLFLSLGKKIFYFAVSFIGLLIVLASLSRAVIIGTMLGIISLFIEFRREKTWIPIAGLILATLVIFSPFILQNIERFEAVLDESDEETEITGTSDKISVLLRKKSADSAFAIFLTNPLLGIGLGNSPKAIGLTVPRTRLDETVSNVHDAHNIYLEILAETGIFGFIFYALFLLQTFFDSGNAKKRFKERKDAEGIMLASGLQISFGVTLFLGLFFNNPFSFNIIMLSGLIIALKKISE
jgi:O-antigen ligase